MTVALAAGAGLYTWRIEPHWVEFVERVQPIGNLPLALAGRMMVRFNARPEVTAFTLQRA